LYIPFHPLRKSPTQFLCHSITTSSPSWIFLLKIARNEPHLPLYVLILKLNAPKLRIPQALRILPHNQYPRIPQALNMAPQTQRIICAAAFEHHMLSLKRQLNTALIRLDIQRVFDLVVRHVTSVEAAVERATGLDAYFVAAYDAVERGCGSGLWAEVLALRGDVVFCLGEEGREVDWEIGRAVEVPGDENDFCEEGIQQGVPVEEDETCFGGALCRLI
jgi:hypothetical protein